MALTKEKKQEIIKDLKEKIGKQKVTVFLDFKGLKAQELFSLRRDLKQLDAKFIVAKKTYVGIAFRDKGMEFDARNLEGQAAVVFGFSDEILPVKAAYDFSKKYKNLKILAGFFENEFKGSEEMIALAQIPPREELLARVVGSISAPISGFANVLQGNIRNLVYALNAIKDNK